MTGDVVYAAAAPSSASQVRPPSGGATLEAVLAGSSEGLLVLRPDGTIVYANAAVRGMLGPAAAIRPGLPAETLFAPPCRTTIRRQLAAACGQGGPEEDATAWLAADPPVEVRVRAAPVREAERGVTGVVLRLWPRAAERQREAEAAHQQRWTQLGQLALSVAHDLGNLLTGVIGAADALGEGHDSAEVATIQAAARRGRALLRQLLAYGSRETGPAGGVMADAAIADIAALVRQMWRGRAHVDLDLAAPEARLAIDATALDQIVLNLALNARDAMLDGGRLTVRTRLCALASPSPTVGGVIPPGDYVMIELADEGIGIAPDVLGRIFDPFFTTKRARGGSGLGLATVLGIVRGAGGGLTVRSEVGRGTVFRIYLPTLAHAGPESGPVSGADARAEPAAAASAGSRSVLLVEDEAMVRRMAARELTRRGWQVRDAASAEAALADLDADGGVPSLVLTDLDLPGMDGVALIRAVRARFGPRLPVLLVSGYQSGRAQAEALGARFLLKPYTAAELADEASAMAPQNDVAQNVAGRIDSQNVNRTGLVLRSTP